MSSALMRAMNRRHADPQAILETALVDGASARELATLAGTALDRHEFKAGGELRDALIDRLLDADWPAVRIADRLGCSERTIRRRAAVARVPRENRMNKRRNPDKSPPRVSFPVLSFSASGTPAETHARIQELLGL